MRRFGLIMITLSLGFLLIGCSDDEDPFSTPQPWVPEAKDFAGYSTWQVSDYVSGNTNDILQGTHSGGNPEYSRRTFISPATTTEGGVRPVGSIIVKETFTWSGGDKVFAESGGVLAMAKREEGFNPGGGDWEWLMLADDGLEIMGRGGADMMNGMCNSCHTMAAGQDGGGDFVFPHPTEFVPAAELFADYGDWPLIGDESGPNSRLGSAHHADDPEAIRRIYRQQLQVNPNLEGSVYPVGTIAVKEVEQGGVVTEITAMVKRGGSFNAENSGWEWYILDPADLSVMSSGADLMGGMCNMCHSTATTSGVGVDYAFAHAADPFNR